MAESLAAWGVPDLFGGVSIDDYLFSLSPTLFAKFNESSGNLINYGSDGNSGTVTGATQGQAGQLGPNEAYLFDGADDMCSFLNADVPATIALTTQRWMFLVNAATLGENNTGMLFTVGATFDVYALRFNSTNRLEAFVTTDATKAHALSNNNQVDFLATWALVFMDYDDANSLGLGRKIRLLRATAASPTTLLTLGTDTAATGTVTPSALALNLGNRSSLDKTMDGLIDKGFAGGDVWSPAGSPADLTLCDEIRSLIFGV